MFNYLDKVQDCVAELQELYKSGDKEQKIVITSYLENILNSKELPFNSLNSSKIEKITNLPNREALMMEIASLKNEAMLIILHMNQIEAVKQLYGFETTKKVIVDKSDKLSQIIKKAEATLYSVNLQKFAILVKERMLFDKYLSILQFSIFNNMENCKYCTDDGDDIITDFTAGVAYGMEHLHHTANVALQEAMISKENYKIYDTVPKCAIAKKITLNKHKVYKDALHEGYVVPFFQPIIDARDGSVMKYEALARLLLPDGTVVAPYHFLNVALEDKTFEFFTRQMMQKVFNIYSSTAAEISMNLTYENIKSKTMLEYIKNRLQKYGGERITFEIVETEEIEDYGVVENFILMIKEYGCKISIDDFGSGYSNFTNLIKLNIDFIKIDGLLITKLLSDEKARLMVQGLIHFAKNINIKTIAEFVSSKELSECVKELGVDYIQGYYHGEPNDAKFYSLT
ncbi:MAG: c-di-GMP phosphodiesterase [Campylobacterota bacterium]|nr:c-di-GMP phosphodiesterase [Campylobacterota bacterium]MDQ1267987.1 c-di-GMP phosphodiesterase [Campylobacterota bacterium]MDQ1337114.1 c-di-GMP phosphodiesterase [Campylobacterota bacterium]